MSDSDCCRLGHRPAVGSPGRRIRRPGGRLGRPFRGRAVPGRDRPGRAAPADGPRAGGGPCRVVARAVPRSWRRHAGDAAATTSQTFNGCVLGHGGPGGFAAAAGSLLRRFALAASPPRPVRSCGGLGTPPGPVAGAPPAPANRLARRAGDDGDGDAAGDPADRRGPAEGPRPAPPAPAP
jgi:hypothetical protein